MDTSHTKVSIVTVVYNGQEVIEDTLRSVSSQDYPNLEYLIIDGGSSDNTNEIINQYKNHIHTHISEPDKGVYDAMNKGINLASGEWIIFMNAGDFFYSKTTISDFFSTLPSDTDKISVLYGDAEFRLKDIAYIVEASTTVNTSEYMPFSHQAAFTRVSIAKNNLFDTNFKIAADTDFFLRLIRKGHHFFHIPITVCSYDALAGLSVDNEVRRCKEIVALQAKWNNIDPESAYFKKYVRSAYIKQYIRKLIPKFIWIKLRERSIKKNHTKFYQIERN